MEWQKNNALLHLFIEKSFQHNLCIFHSFSYIQFELSIAQRSFNNLLVLYILDVTIF